MSILIIQCKMILGYLCIIALTIQSGNSREIKPANCRRVYDKYDRQKIASRNFLYGKVWPDNVIPYEIAPGYDTFDQMIIKRAMKHISDGVCVKWKPRSGETNYVRINHDELGCFTTMGYDSIRGMHNLNLQRTIGQTTCMRMGIAAHEMLHVMGFDHEHSRPDRNKYVKVKWENMDPRFYAEFFRDLLFGSKEQLPICDPKSPKKSFDDCYSGYVTETFGMDYDYGSIMHYGLKKCSLKDQEIMLVLKDVPIGTTIGEMKEMSKLDVQKARAKYGCDGPTPPKT